ncbi:hypothetical protein IAD21_01239 [Abditibacteriota bacterium]|nr:hypothetical protein IAD21_01239 [Abditibacteriota bacterium]
MFRYRHLSRHAGVFQHLTGLRLGEFEVLTGEMVPVQEAAHRQKLAHREKPRTRAVGGGTPFSLSHQDQLLLCVIWLRRYPTHETLGYLFGVDATTIGRVLERVLPLLSENGRDTMKLPDPGRKRRVSLDELLKQTPELAVIVDSFEQRVQKPQRKGGSGSGSGSNKDSHYSGKKKQHTLKSQVAVDEETGLIVDVSASVPGPTADKRLLLESKLLDRVPWGVGVLGDLAYLGLDKDHPQGLGATPRRKPRAKERPTQDKAFNLAFARRRIQVEHSIGHLRRYESVSQMDRHHRQHHAHRVQGVAGLVNRQLQARHPYLFA